MTCLEPRRAVKVFGAGASRCARLFTMRVVAPMFVPHAGAPPEPVAKAIAVFSAVGSIALGIGPGR